MMISKSLELVQSNHKNQIPLFSGANQDHVSVRIGVANRSVWSFTNVSGSCYTIQVGKNGRIIMLHTMFSNNVSRMKIFNFEYDLIEICCQGCNWQQTSAWTNAYPVHWRTYASLSFDLLITCLTF